MSYVCVGVCVSSRGAGVLPYPSSSVGNADSRLIISSVAQDEATFNIYESTGKGCRPLVISGTFLGPVHHFGSITELQG